MELAQRRVKFREGLHALYLPIYDSICESLSPYWAPFYGVRSISEQDALYAIGRTINIDGKTVTNAQGGFSPHNYGCASDWVLWDVGGKPIWMAPYDSRWQEYKTAVLNAKGRWGGLFHLVDCPHNELPLSVLWHSVGNVLKSQGMDTAVEFFTAKIEV